MIDFLYKYDVMLEELYNYYSIAKEAQYGKKKNIFNKKQFNFNLNILHDYQELESKFRTFHNSLENNIATKNSSYKDLLSKNLHLYYSFIDTYNSAVNGYMCSNDPSDDLNIKVDELEDAKILHINCNSKYLLDCNITYSFRNSSINTPDSSSQNILEEFIEGNESKIKTVVFVDIDIEYSNEETKSISSILDCPLPSGKNKTMDEITYGTIYKLTNRVIYDTFLYVLHKIYSYSSFGNEENCENLENMIFLNKSGDICIDL